MEHPDNRQEQQVFAIEREAKYLLAPHLTCPESATYIEQHYLSSPYDEASLRLRKTLRHYETTPTFCATIKSRRLDNDQLSRHEVEVPIDEGLFDYYTSQRTHPTIKKFRADLGDGITADWLLGSSGDVTPFLLEIERRTGSVAAPAQLVATTNPVSIDNESVAWSLHDKMPTRPSEACSSESLHTLAHHIAATNPSVEKPYVLSVSGRSGSGKSTLLRTLQASLAAQNISVMVLSTDDYHVGKARLDSISDGAPWQDWDAPEVYDTALCSRELRAYLDQRTAIPKRAMNWSIQEPIVTGTHQEAAVILVEGLYAHSPLLLPLATDTITVPTSLATSLWRRLCRDFGSAESRANESLPDIASSLRYYLEYAEPAYRRICQDADLEPQPSAQ